MSNEAMQWLVGILVVLVGGLVALSAATFYAVPMTAYAWSWWKLALGW